MCATWQTQPDLSQAFSARRRSVETSAIWGSTSGAETIRAKHGYRGQSARVTVPTVNGMHGPPRFHQKVQLLILTTRAYRLYDMTIPMIENWCDQCVNGVTYNVDPLMMATLVADNVLGMGPFGARSCMPVCPPLVFFQYPVGPETG